MEFNLTNAETELARMYHAKQIGFTEYHMQHKMVCYTYSTFEMEGNHAVIRKTFEAVRSDGKSYADRIDSLERRTCNDLRQSPRRQAFL